MEVCKGVIEATDAGGPQQGDGIEGGENKKEGWEGERSGIDM